MSIVLIRHGQTDLNAARVLQWPDTPLGERGRAQALALARRLSDARPAAIACSDMARARQTAEPLAQAAGLPLIETPLLGERNFGVLRGQRFDALGHDPIEDEAGAPEGESMPQFRQRVEQAFVWVRALRERAGGDLLVVTHGLVLREILTRHAALDAGVSVPARLANTSVSVIDARAPHRVRLLGCSRHLEGATSDDGGGVSGV
jgi:probable phosphoglycerate mutase